MVRTAINSLNLGEAHSTVLAILYPGCSAIFKGDSTLMFEIGVAHQLSFVGDVDGAHLLCDERPADRMLTYTIGRAVPNAGTQWRQMGSSLN